MPANGETPGCDMRADIIASSFSFSSSSSKRVTCCVKHDTANTRGGLFADSLPDYVIPTGSMSTVSVTSSGMVNPVVIFASVWLSRLMDLVNRLIW